MSVSACMVNKTDNTPRLATALPYAQIRIVLCSDDKSIFGQIIGQVI